MAIKESLTLVGHRSLLIFAEKDVIYFGIAAHLAHQKQPNLKTDQYYLNKLEKRIQTTYYFMVLKKIMIFIDIILKNVQLD